MKATVARFFFSLVLALAAAFSATAVPLPFAPPETPPRYMPTRTYDLQHLRLDLAFDWATKTVAGTVTNTLSPLLPGLDAVVFHAVGLDVRQVRVNGAERPFTLDPRAGTLTTDLGRAYGPQDRLEVAVDYSARPQAGLYFVGPDRAYPAKPRQIYSQGETELNRYWFPSWDYPNDRTTTEMIATVKRPFEVVSNGELLEVIDRPDGRRTFHWRMDVPHATYLVSVAAGEFVKVSDPWRVPVDYYVPPSHDAEARARRSFGDTPKILEYYAQATGRPYPYAKYAQAVVIDYMGGGMENISATTQSVRTLHDARAALDFTSERLVAHEAAHQWFGDLLTCEDWSNVWLNEGFAQYFMALYKRNARGDDEFDLEMDELRAHYLSEASQYRRPIVSRRYADPYDMFDVHSYEKGALVLHMTRYLLGEEGWWKGIRSYVDRFAGQTVTTPELQSAMEEATGVSLGTLFDPYVYGAGHPELKVTWDWQPETRQVRLEVRQVQELDAQTGLFSFPLEVALVEAGKVVVRRVPVAARQLQDLYVPSEERPRTVVLDPQGWILKAVELAKPAAEWAVQLAELKPLAARLEAIRALAELGDGEAVAALGRVLREEPFYGLRREAAMALGKIATGEALDALRAGLDDKDSRVRTAVLESFGRFPEHAELIPVLRRALEEEESYYARAAAATALGAFESRRGEVVPLLLAALAQESFRETVRAAAIKALAKIDPAQGYGPALRLAKYGAPIDSRDEALEALVAIAQEDRRRHDEIRTTLEGYLNDPSFVLREKAYRVLGTLGDPAAIRAIERRARAEAEERQRRNAAKAVEEIRARRAEGREEQALRDRVEQLERETEVLKEQLREVREAKAGSQ